MPLAKFLKTAVGIPLMIINVRNKILDVTLIFLIQISADNKIVFHALANNTFKKMSWNLKPLFCNQKLKYGHHTAYSIDCLLEYVHIK